MHNNISDNLKCLVLPQNIVPVGLFSRYSFPGMYPAGFFEDAGFRSEFREDSLLGLNYINSHCCIRIRPVFDGASSARLIRFCKSVLEVRLSFIQSCY